MNMPRSFIVNMKVKKSLQSDILYLIEFFIFKLLRVMRINNEKYYRSKKY